MTSGEWVTILRGKTSLQFKFSMSYILIILAVLVLLNTYPLLVSQSLVFRTKETAMKSSVKMVESALSGLPELTEENVGQALASVEETGVSRLLVTDTSGCILFDTREGGSARGCTPCIPRSSRLWTAATPSTAGMTAMLF